jgi:hypothetical protein
MSMLYSLLFSCPAFFGLGEGLLLRFGVISVKDRELHKI